MKTIIAPPRSQCGSILLISLVITAIIGITLASYFIMAQSQNVSVVKSQTWNSAIALSEAGVEDALAMLNKNSGDFDILYNWTNSWSLSADNWQSLGNNVYYVRRYLGSNYYDVYVTNLNSGPVIRSIGTVAWNHTYASAPQGFLATVGANSPSAPTLVTRKLEVRTKVDPLFNVAMAALKTIDFNGKNIMTDSFDSSLPDYSATGLYPLGNVNKTKAGGDVVTDDTIIGALDVGNAKIKGVVKTGPHGTVDIGANGSVGDREWVEGGNKGIKPGHSSDDMNVLFGDVKLPAGALGWWEPAFWQKNVTVNGTTYDYAFTSPTLINDYKVSSLTGKIYVGPLVKVRLYVTGNASFSGQNRVDLWKDNTGHGSLKIYVGGTFSDTGSGFLNNMSQNAANFYLYGLPTCTSVSLGGNAAFTGVIYAPSAHFSLGGGGSTTYDFVGSSVSKSVQMNGHFNFHYDENLRNIGLGRGYIPTNWKEVQ